MRARGAAALLALGLGSAAFALPPEKGGPVHAHVEMDGGQKLSGRARAKKGFLEVETSGGTKKAAWNQIVSIEEYDPEAPPPEAQRPLDRAEYEKRAQAIEARTDDEPAKRGVAWRKLGEWALKRALEGEAKKAFEKAIEAAPDDDEARRGLGLVKDEDGKWENVHVVYARKKAAAGEKTSEIHDLVRWCTKQRLDEQALELLAPFAAKDAYDKTLLTLLRPVTDRRRQKTDLAFPLKGRWKADPDTSHHHDKKSFAVYALDFYREVNGRPYKDSGKKLEDWYSWDQPIYAAADGVVVDVREGFPDNPINEQEGKWEKHNGIYIHHENGESSWYLHTKLGSIKFKKGDRVKRGDLIATVGNSGGSGAPHLHFTLVDAWKALSVPWRCRDYGLVTEDGHVIKVKYGRPIEGQSLDGGPEK